MKRILVILAAAMLSFSLNAQSLGGLKSSRVDFGFLMGWDGLGTSPLSGMQTMDDNAYSTRPWFNSWQLEFTYNFVKAGDLKAFFGIGYESDVFRMDYDYVYLARYDANGDLLPKAQMCVADQQVMDDNNISPYEGWETRLVARYITIPIGISYDFSHEFGLGLALIPGINYSSSYTGMKYSNFGSDIRSMRDDLSGYIRPYKMDVRFNVNFSFFSVFMQLSTLPLFRKTDKSNIYPFRMGFMLKI
ncbi:MAG: hypothetical protein IJU90_08480 [Bacteroidales bacterium]|nr:hypothetical protein [Bacteroidales bacterium]